MDRRCPGWGVSVYPLIDPKHWASPHFHPLSQQSLQLCLALWPPNCHGLSQGPWGQWKEHLDLVTGQRWGSEGRGAEADLNEFQNLSRALVWTGEGPRGRGAVVRAKQEGEIRAGQEGLPEPLGWAGGKIMELVQEAELGRGWPRWPQPRAQPVSVPTSQGDTGHWGHGRNMVWFRGQPRGAGQTKFSLKFQAGHGSPGEGRMPKSTVRPGEVRQGMGRGSSLWGLQVATRHVLQRAGGLQRPIRRSNPIVANVFKSHTVS